MIKIDHQKGKKVPPEIAERLKELVDKCTSLKQEEAKIQTEFKMAKSELEMMADHYGISYAQTDDNEVTVKHSKRFKQYSDESQVIDQIPPEWNPSKTMSLDRKKINELIKAGELPKSIQKYEESTEITSYSFKMFETDLEEE